MIQHWFCPRFHQIFIRKTFSQVSRTISNENIENTRSGSLWANTCPLRQFRPKHIRMGWSTHVIKELLPFTAEMLASKSRPFENIAVGYCLPSDPYIDNASEIGIKKVEDSYLEIILPFADQPDLRHSMTRLAGSNQDSSEDTLLYGKLFEILDALAADVSYRHCGGGREKYTIVTASIDGFRSFHKSLGSSSDIDLINNDMKLQAYLTYVGSSSMEVTIDLISKDIHGQEIFVGTTQFIMVARDPKSNKAKQIHKLNLDDPLVKEEFHRGQLRASDRKNRAAISLSITPPSNDEVQYMHKLYLESKELKAKHNRNVLNARDPSKTSVISKNYKWMNSTVFKSVLLMHKQQRNVHGKIFGGYILRVAYDLAFIGASYFFGIEDPVFVCVDDVQFVKPVNIGSIMEFTTTVTYNLHDTIVIQIHAADVDYKTGERTRTNILSYVFRYPSYYRDPSSPGYSTFDDLPKVIPNEYDEFILYLEGRRAMNKLKSLTELKDLTMEWTETQIA